MLLCIFFQFGAVVIMYINILHNISTLFKAKSLGIALAWTIAESTIEELQSLLRRKSLSFENCASLSSGLLQIRTILYTSE